MSIPLRYEKFGGLNGYDLPLVTTHGRSLAQGTLEPGESLFVGRYRLSFDDKLSQLVLTHPGFDTVLEVNQLVVRIRGRSRGRTLLAGIDCQFRAGELIAVVGPSGSGKSTLLGALLGDVRLTSGLVRLDGADVAEPGGAIRRRLSFVPQDDLVLAHLTVDETLRYAARLGRLAHGDRTPVAQPLLDDLLERVGLANLDVRGSLIGDTTRRGISGGQRRRVSVAQELVGDETDVLLLDEPASGLDPQAEANMSILLRELADAGRIVVVSTHAVALENLFGYDKVLCLDAAGRSAFFGPPEGMLSHFSCTSVAQVFERLVNVVGREQHEDAVSISPPPRSHTVSRRDRSFSSRTVLVRLGLLIKREFVSRIRDLASISLVMALPLAIPALCSLVYHRSCVAPSLLLVLCLSSVWSGISFTIRDINANVPLLRHECRGRSPLITALAAKVIVATLASSVQAILLALSLFVVFGAEDVYTFAGWVEAPQRVSLVSGSLALLVLFASHVFGNALGLALSAFFRTTEAAIFTVPFVILPMVTFSGLLVPPRELSPAASAVMRATPLYGGYVGLLGSVASVSISVPVDHMSEVGRELNCSLENRTIRAVGSNARVRSYVQPREACVFAEQVSSSVFAEQNGLPAVPEIDPYVPGLSELNPSQSVTGALTLSSYAALLYVLAFLLARRRMSEH